MPTLHWIGKDKVINHHLEVPYRILQKQYTFGDAEKSENKIIHGDNLDALKSLLPEYEGKVKCIYIDPPYNTGNEGWIYNDNSSDPKLKKWLNKFVGKEGEDLTRHDKWLCMMYPRLKLLQKLLSEDGVIFTSINFLHEHAHLRLIMDEIFGKNNCLGEITWESTTQPINSGSARFGLQQKVEPIIFYAKNIKFQNGFILEEIESGLKYPHDGRLGKCRFEIIEKSDAGSYERKTMKFPILGQLPREGKRWQIGEDLARELERDGKVEIVDGMIKRAVYPEDELDKRKFIPFWSHFTASQTGTAQTGKDLLNEVMGTAIGFDTVKPVKLIEELLSHFSKDSIILDSFAGSGTTAHAVLNMNKKDGGNRKFILVETEDYAETITAGRIKNVVTGYTKKDNVKGVVQETKVDGTDGGFEYLTVGNPLMTEDRLLSSDASLEDIRSYICYTETGSHMLDTPLVDHPYWLARSEDRDHYFYFERESITVLDREFLSTIVESQPYYTIWADQCHLSASFMKKEGITFRKIPRDIRNI